MYWFVSLWEEKKNVEIKIKTRQNSQLSSSLSFFFLKMQTFVIYNSCTVVLFNTHEQTFTKRLKNGKCNDYVGWICIAVLMADFTLLSIVVSRCKYIGRFFSRGTSRRNSERHQFSTGWVSHSLVAGRSGNIVLESRQPPVRPRSSDPYGSLLEKSILLCDGTIIRQDGKDGIIDYLLLRDPDYLEKRYPRRCGPVSRDQKRKGRSW